MKRILLLTAVAFLGLSIATNAQPYYDRQIPANTQSIMSVDLHLGKCITFGANLIAGADFAALHKFSPNFALGAGAGIDYVQGLKVRNVPTKENQYRNELTLPVFARGRYLFGRRGMIGNYDYGTNNMYSAYREPREGMHFFVQADFGYRFNLTSFNFEEDSSEGLADGNIKGFFFEPQGGISLGRNIDIAVGIPFQGFNKNLIKTAGGAVDASKSIYIGGVAHLTFSW